jgi:photosystem II stability/assembly factor-like uncharacterized protein
MFCSLKRLTGCSSLLLAILGIAAVAPTTMARQAHTNTVPVMNSLVPATSVQARDASFARRRALMESSLLARVPATSIGPTVMSGRIVDIDASEANPTRFFIAYASGGLWKTDNNGQSFTSVFDNQSVMTIGDIAVDWSHGETIWVGTGENNSSRSSYAGDGIYRSDDGGETWTRMGLEDTQRIGRIVIHPDNPDKIWVAALGHLYSPSADRGVFMSEDGGKSWTKTLYVDENSGAIDLVLDPTNPDVLYAATWQRARRAWNFVEGGPGSGIFKSTDGGKTWTRLDVEGSGFPRGDGVGRIGLAIYPGNSQIVYAVLDNQFRRPAEEDEEAEEGLTRDQLRSMSGKSFLKLDAADVEAYLIGERFPKKYSVDVVTDMIRSGTIEPSALVSYVEDANAQLFDTSVIGAEVYRSDDGGATWRKTHDDYLDAVYNSYGYYFGQIRVAPDNPDQIYIHGVPILRSDDGGATFASIGERHVHGDHHALWIDPNDSGHIINGNDGGLNISYDYGKTWIKANTPAVGQFYAIQVDNAKPYNVYGGIQDNGVWMGPHTYRAGYAWYGNGNYPYDFIAGGDGMQVEVDTRTNDIVYTGSQFGFYARINRTTGERLSIRPRHELGENPLRFNWQVPIHLSRHNQDILYYGANRLYRSMNQGEDFEAISGDLTHGGQAGDVPYGTLSTIDESPLEFGLLYTGSDDGYVYVSEDSGHKWRRISDSLPQDRWVSRVEASAHEKSRVYVSLNGYRSDDFSSYVYRSDDYGSTWTQIGKDLPAEPVNVITEDPHNGDVLYVGTDHGVYVSLDGGDSFMAMSQDLPGAPVHDLKVQAREKDLIVGTHGRSLYLADVAPVEAMTSELLAEKLHIFDLPSTRFSASWGRKRAVWSEPFVPEMTVVFFSGSDGTATVSIVADSTVLVSFDADVLKGLNYISYDLSVDPDVASKLAADEVEGEEGEQMKEADNGTWYLTPGKYTLRVDQAGASAKAKFEIKSGRR